MFVSGTETELPGNYIQWFVNYNELAGKGILSEYANLVYDSAVIVLKKQSYVNDKNGASGVPQDAAALPVTASQVREWEIFSYDNFPANDDNDKSKPVKYSIIYKADRTREVIAYNINSEELSNYSFKYDLNSDTKFNISYLNDNKLKD